jgi:hypothetical protein
VSEPLRTYNTVTIAPGPHAILPPMKRALLAASLLILAQSYAHGRGVSPYLPLNLDPAIERRIERVLILADQPVLRRPIAAATVLDALPAACRKDVVLCEEVRRYLRVYTKDAGISHASIEAASSRDAQRPLPNRYGMDSGDEWAASVTAYWQPDDRVLLTGGAIAYPDTTDPSGSMLSLGWDFAQLDIGYRPHWLSPFSTSSMLMSTEARTMASVTLSNYRPLTRFGFTYELFASRMSRTDGILFQGDRSPGRPDLAGLSVGIEPATGWALSLNRLLQYGGGERPGTSLRDVLEGLVRPGPKDNAAGLDEQLGNQVGSITSSFIFPGRTPFSVYFEYAGEDTSRGGSTTFGNASLSAGIRFPQLWRRFDLTLETSEWQNFWYVNTIYGNGLTNKGRVLGHWGASERVFGDGVGAQAQTVRIGWDAPFGGLVEAQYQRVVNESYGVIDYEREENFLLRYTYPWRDFNVGAEVFAGKDVFGENFSRVAAFFRYTGLDSRSGRATTPFDDTPEADPTAQVFVEAGAFAYEVRVNPDAGTPTVKSGWTVAPQLGIGARRAVSDRSDLGARLEINDLDGDLLVAVRALDYRYRFRGPLALSFFVGAAHYDKETPAIGLYVGTGLQWRDVLPGWDAGVDLRFIQNAARDRLLPTDPTGIRPDIFYDVLGATFSVTKRF